MLFIGTKIMAPPIELRRDIYRYINQEMQTLEELLHASRRIKIPPEVIVGHYLMQTTNEFLVRFGHLRILLGIIAKLTLTNCRFCPINTIDEGPRPKEGEVSQNNRHASAIRFLLNLRPEYWNLTEDALPKQGATRNLYKEQHFRPGSILDLRTLTQHEPNIRGGYAPQNSWHFLIVKPGENTRAEGIDGINKDLTNEQILWERFRFYDQGGTEYQLSNNGIISIPEELIALGTHIHELCMRVKGKIPEKVTPEDVWKKPLPKQSNIQVAIDRILLDAHEAGGDFEDPPEAAAGGGGGGIFEDPPEAGGGGGKVSYFDW